MLDFAPAEHLAPAELLALQEAFDIATAEQIQPPAPAVHQALWRPQPGPQTDAFTSDADEILYGGQAGGGKMLTLDTPIPTPSGWMSMEEVRVGDTVFGRDGQTHAVLYESPVRLVPGWRLTFDDGSSIVACGDHLWLTFTAADMDAMMRRSAEWRARRRASRPSRATGRRSERFTAAISARNAAAAPAEIPPPAGGVRTTAEIVATLRMADGRTNHAIPVAEPLQLPDREFLLDPYLLGVWLGDGTTTAGSITSADPEILTAFTDQGFQLGGSLQKENNRASTTTVLGLRPILRSIGVFGNKHVPDEYLWASEAQRLALLQGLMDTDGNVAGRSVEFLSTRQALTEAVAQLAISLGMKCTVRSARAKLNGQDYGPTWRVKFAANRIVFRLPRKAESQQLAVRQTTRYRYIVQAEPVDPAPMKCIQVAAPDALYLAGRQMVPTHNTDWLLGMALERHTRTVLFRRIGTTLTDIVTRGKEIIGDAASFNGSSLMWTFNDGTGRSLQLGSAQHEDDVNKWRGRPHDLKAFDELTEFSKAQYLFLGGWARTTLRHQKVQKIAGTNPPFNAEGEWVIERWAPWLDPQHPHPAKPGELRWFAMIEDKDTEVEDGRPILFNGDPIYPQSRTFIPAALSDNAYLASDSAYRATLQALPEPLRSQLLLGLWNTGMVDDPYSAIPISWIREAQKRWVASTTQLLSAIGVDVARGGRDKTVFVPRHGTWFGQPLIYPGEATPDGEAVAQLLTPLLTGRKGAIGNIDVIGVGSSAYDVSRLMNLPVWPIHNAARAVDARGNPLTDRSGRLTFANIRAASYWYLREALDPAHESEIQLPPSRTLAADLAAARWKLQGARIALEKKEEVAERLTRSPDEGDATVLASWIDPQWLASAPSRPTTRPLNWG